MLIIDLIENRFPSVLLHFNEKSIANRKQNSVLLDRIVITDLRIHGQTDWVDVARYFVTSLTIYFDLSINDQTKLIFRCYIRDKHTCYKTKVYLKHSIVQIIFNNVFVYYNDLTTRQYLRVYFRWAFFFFVSYISDCLLATLLREKNKNYNDPKQTNKYFDPW